MPTSAAYTTSTVADSALRAGVVAELTLAKSGSSPLSSISLSSDQRHGVVGGRELMKVRCLRDSNEGGLIGGQVSALLVRWVLARCHVCWGAG